MLLREVLEDSTSNELDKICYLGTSTRVLVAQRVEDHRTVDVHVFGKRVVLEGVFGIDDWGRCIFLLLFGLFPKEDLVVLKVL